MSAKHTVTPWRAECWSCHAPTTILVDDPQEYTGKRVVAECESVDDAAFIVRACNAHDDLVKALKALDAMYIRAWDTTTGDLIFSPESVKKFESAHEQARAALAKAGAA